MNRLVTSQTAVVGPTISYSLDGVGNRVTVTGGTNAGSYFMNPAIPPADFQMNQYTTTPFDARTNDANGNLTSAGGQQFFYDYRNRLVGVWQPASTNAIEFKYDCFGRRVEKTTPTAAERYYYADWQEMEEQDRTDSTLATHVWGSRIDELLSMGRGGEDFFYHAGDLDSVRKVTDMLGDVVEQYRYGDYGEPSLFDGTNGPLASTKIGNSTLFTGRPYDAETDLYYYRTRHLDPRAGRFTTSDTVGIWGDQDNLGNGYGYVGNSPCNASDSFGFGGTISVPIDNTKAYDEYWKTHTICGNVCGAIGKNPGVVSGKWWDSANLGNGYAYVGNKPTTHVDPTGRGGADFMKGTNLGKAKWQMKCNCK